LVDRAGELGERLRERLGALLGKFGVTVRGAGLMIGVDLGPRPGAAVQVQERLLERGYIVSTGGGAREVLVLTPPLTIAEELCASPALDDALTSSLSSVR
jgi:4-aminobutyrate aminotransferase-like enzyme